MRKNKYDITREAYDKVAFGYAKNSYSQLSMKPYIDEFSKTLPKNGLVLDLGCGPGQDSYIFTKSGYRVIGVDFSKEMIKEAKKRVPNAKFILENMKDIKFPKSTFDGIWIVGSLHHLPNIEAKELFSRLWSMSKTGMHGFVSTQKGVGEKFRIHKQVGVGTITKKFWAFWEPEDLRKALGKSNFTVTKVMVVEAKQRKKYLRGKMKQEKWITVWFQKDK